ncbi:hypothetical protein BC332_02845 [Capsicum chinense]|nr:hypothetical protein BC332_02845 [Capsicum chinense]
MELSLRLLGSKGKVEGVQDVPWWSVYIVILKHLYNVSKLCNSLENKFREMMKRVKSSLSFLLILFDHQEVNPTHLEYFRFSGRMIALALMHDLQIEVVFDRVFFLHLAGKGISLQDTKDADPILYNIYKQILNMDLEMVD